MADPNPITLPFAEAVEYFRAKLNLPTLSWTDIWQHQHAHAFVVAGAVKQQLLDDFREAIDQAISQGTSYAAFREQFRDIVRKHGWSYNGGEGWRSRVIYHTNMQTSYQAGRYQQMQQITQRRPYWQYKHSNLVEDPRPEHQAWDGLTLRHDDPFWKTHYPPNGWGCRCKVYALSDRDLARQGKTGADTAPDIVYVEQVVGIRGPNPRSVSTPVGIDPGWAYNVGEAAPGEGVNP